MSHSSPGAEIILGSDMVFINGTAASAARAVAKTMGRIAYAGCVKEILKGAALAEKGRSVLASLRVGSIVLRVDDLRRQTEFWAAALDYVPREGSSEDFALLRPRNGAGPNLSLDRHRSELQIPPRIHLDLYTGNQAEEVRRLLALGATEVHWSKRPADADYVILADPEGNRFCVVDVSRK